MKIIRVCCFLLFTLLISARADSTNQFWFPIGETLTYKLYWGMIPVGYAELSSSWVSGEDGRPMILLSARARSNSVIAKLYPVDDRVESLVDPRTFLPTQYIQILREGRSRRDDKMTFDHAGGKVVWESLVGSSEKKELAIGGDTRDVLSFAYYMRSQEYEPGRREVFFVVVDDKLYDLELTGIKRETMSVPTIGKVESLKVEPKAKFGEIFVRKGHLMMWFSEDSRRVCTRIAGKVLKIISIKALLVRVSGPGSDRWSQARWKGAEDESAEDESGEE